MSRDAIDNLFDAAKAQSREVLFDTMNVEIERSLMDTSAIAGPPIVTTVTTVSVSAEAVKTTGAI